MKVNFHLYDLCGRYLTKRNLATAAATITLSFLLTFASSNTAKAQSQGQGCPNADANGTWGNNLTTILPGAQIGQNVIINFCYRCYVENGVCKREIYINHITVEACIGCDLSIQNDTSWYFQMVKGNLATAMARKEPPFDGLACECAADIVPCGELTSGDDSHYTVVVVGHAKCVIRYYLANGTIYIANCPTSDNCKTTYCFCGDGQVVYANDCGNQQSLTEIGNACADCTVQSQINGIPVINSDPPRSVCEE